MSTSEKPFTHDQLLKALYFIFDLFSRANMPFFLTEDTAECAKKGLPLKGNKVTVGIRQLDNQAHSFSILEAFFLADKIGKNQIRYTYEGIPIIVEVVHDNDPMYTFTDTIIYQQEWFHLPNPYDKYVEKRSQFI